MWVTLFATGFVLAISLAPAEAAILSHIGNAFNILVRSTSRDPGITVTPSMTLQDVCRQAVKMGGLNDGMADTLKEPVGYLANARTMRPTTFSNFVHSLVPTSIFGAVPNLLPPTNSMTGPDPKEFQCLYRHIQGAIRPLMWKSTPGMLGVMPPRPPTPKSLEELWMKYPALHKDIMDTISEYFDGMPGKVRRLREVFGLKAIARVGEASPSFFGFFNPSPDMAIMDPDLNTKLDNMMQPCKFCVPHTPQPLLLAILKHYRPQLVIGVLQLNPTLKSDADILSAVLAEVGKVNAPLKAMIENIPRQIGISKIQAKHHIFSVVRMLKIKTTPPAWKPPATTNTGINMGTMMNMMAGMMQQTAAGTTGTGTMPSQSAAASNVQTVQPAATPIDPWAQAKKAAETIFGTPANPAVPASSAPSAPATGMGSTQQGTVVPAAAPAAPVASATVAATTNKMATSQGTAAVASAVPAVSVVNPASAMMTLPPAAALQPTTGVTSTTSTAEEMEANKIVASILSNTDSGPVSVLPDLTNPKTRNLVLAGLEAKLAKITQAIAHISASPTMIQTASAGTAGGTGGTATGTLSTNTATTMASQTTMAPIASANNGGTNSAPAMMNLADMIGMFMPQAGASASVAPTANMSPATNPSPVVAAPSNPTTVAPGGTADQGAAANTGGGMTVASQTNPPQTANVNPGADTSGTVNTATQSAQSPSLDVFDLLSAVFAKGTSGSAPATTGAMNTFPDLAAILSTFGTNPGAPQTTG